MKKEKTYYVTGWMTVAILFLLSLLPFSQVQAQDKGTGWLYFSTTPSTTPNPTTGSELAWRTDTKEAYYWDRNSSTWKRLLNFYQSSGVPTLNPTTGTNYNNQKLYFDFLNADFYRWDTATTSWKKLGEGGTANIKRLPTSSASMQVRADSVGINYDSLSTIDSKKIATKIQDSISYVELDQLQAMAIAQKIVTISSAKQMIQDSTSIVDTITVVNDTTLRVFLKNNTTYDLVVKGKSGVTKSILLSANSGQRLLDGVDTLNITSSLGIFQTVISGNSLFINFVGGQNGEILTASGSGYYWGKGAQVDSVFALNDTVLTIVLLDNTTYNVAVKGIIPTQSQIKFTELDFVGTSGFSDFVDNTSSGGSGDGVITLISRPHVDTLQVVGQDGGFSGKIYIGRNWSEIKNKPVGFSDDIDNVNDLDSIFGNELITSRIIRNDSIFLIENGVEWFSGKNTTGGGTQNLNSVLTQSNDAGGLKITGLANPTLTSDAVTLGYANTNFDISNTNEKEVQESTNTDLAGAVFAPILLGFRRDNGTMFYNNNGSWTGFGFLKTEIDGSITNEKIDSFKYELGILRIKENGINYNLSLNNIPLSAFSNDLNMQTNTLTNSFVWVGNGSNIATGVDVVGDVELANTGVTTIQNNAVTTTKIINAAVTPEKLDRTYLENIEHDNTILGEGTSESPLKVDSTKFVTPLQIAELFKNSSIRPYSENMKSGVIFDYTLVNNTINSDTLLFASDTTNSIKHDTTLVGEGTISSPLGVDTTFILSSVKSTNNTQEDSITALRNRLSNVSGSGDWTDAGAYDYNDESISVGKTTAPLTGFVADFNGKIKAQEIYLSPTASQPFTISDRNSTGGVGSFNFPVIEFRAGNSNTASVMDLYPNGDPGDQSYFGKAWFHICNTDLKNNNNPSNCVGLSSASNRHRLMIDNFNGATALPFSIATNGGNIATFKENSPVTLDQYTNSGYSISADSMINYELAVISKQTGNIKKINHSQLLTASSLPVNTTLTGNNVTITTSGTNILTSNSISLTSGLYRVTWNARLFNQSTNEYLRVFMLSNGTEIQGTSNYGDIGQSVVQTRQSSKVVTLDSGNHVFVLRGQSFFNNNILAQTNDSSTFFQIEKL